MTIIPAPITPTTKIHNILKTTSVLELGDVALNEYLDCLLRLDAWMEQHGTPNGFSYGVVVPQPVANWWDNKNPRFDCWAKPGCRIMKVPAQDGFTQAVGAEPVFRTQKGGEHMDVFEVWRPGGWPPDWFVVLKTEVYWLVCLASETTEAPPP